MQSHKHTCVLVHMHGHIPICTLTHRVTDHRTAEARVTTNRSLTGLSRRTDRIWLYAFSLRDHRSMLRLFIEDRETNTIC
jgi:hypothetical protein